jgi:hypothetical protein
MSWSVVDQIAVRRCGKIVRFGLQLPSHMAQLNRYVGRVLGHSSHFDRRHSQKRGGVPGSSGQLGHFSSSQTGLESVGLVFQQLH